MGLCHFWPAQYSSATDTLSFVRWLDLFGSINIQFLYANLWVPIIAFKSNLQTFEDRVIASILGKSCDVAFIILFFEPSFYSIYFAVTLHDSKLSFVLHHPCAYHMIFKWKGFMKVSRRQVKVCGRQFSCIKGNMRFTIAVDVVWGGVGVDERIGSFQYSMP